MTWALRKSLTVDDGKSFMLDCAVCVAIELEFRCGCYIRSVPHLGRYSIIHRFEYMEFGTPGTM